MNPTFNSKGKAIGGFTLLEVMVAISVIAIVMLSIHRMQAQTVSMSMAARFYTIAPLLAEDKLAEIEMAQAGQWSSDEGNFADKFPNFGWKMIIDTMESELLGDHAEHIKKIDVIISFNNDEYLYYLRTYRFSEAL